MTALIPIMTHPLGMGWDQPERNEITLDEECAMMTRSTFDKLSNYSMSIPTGAYEGKMWKSVYKDGNWLTWYGFSEDPSKVSINTLPILIIEEEQE